MNNTEENEVFETPFDWNLLTICVTVLTLALLCISATLNLSTCCAVCFCSQPRRYGYYHLLNLFSILNLLYFILKAALLVVQVSVSILDLFPQEWYEFVATYTIYIPDILTCILGTSLLLLTVMTIDCLCSNSCRSKCVQKCFRTFDVLLVAVVSAVVILIVAVFKFNLLFDGFGLGKAVRYMIVSGSYLVAFALVPSFFIVILGAINWVTDLNSTRPVKVARKMSRSIDHKICILTVLLLLLFLVTTILRFSQDLDIYDNEQESELTNFAVEMLQVSIDVLYAVYPVIFVCTVGRFCCCCNMPEYE